MHLPVEPLAASQLDAPTAEAIATAPAAALILVSAPNHSDIAASTAAVLVATHPGHEVVLVAAEGTRWTVGDIDREVIGRARFAPDQHRHIVVADAHRATPLVHDRLLKALEDAAEGTSVWLTHDRAATLPAALRGRSATQISARAATRAAMADVLRSTANDPSLDEHAATRVLALADGNLTLAYAAHRFGLHDQLNRYAARRDTNAPTVLAHELTLALAHLAAAHHHKTKKAPAAPVGRKGAAPSADLSRLTPPAKATLRKLVDAVLARWESDVTAELADASTARGRQLCGQFLGLRQIREHGTFSTPVTTVLASALVIANN